MIKAIATLRDLAINGAPPAFAEPLHVGWPNIGDRESFFRYATEIFERRWLSNNGPLVQELEKRVADFHRAKNCIAMCNGTIALEVAIRALDMAGEVILPSYTFVATAHSLNWQGIKPVFADIDPATHCLDPDAVRRMITPRTSGIIGVHLWGRSAPVEALQKIADEHGLQLMYDAAHAFGCSYGGSMVGNFGRCEVLSFHATKFFNTFEGGAVLTNDDELAEKMRLMRNFGFAGLDNVIHRGTNGKMIEIAAAMGLVNLDAIDRVIAANKNNYECYCAELVGLPGISLIKFDDAQRNNYQYVVMEVCEECPVSRDSLIEALHAENILARKYFWPGCHNMEPYHTLDPRAGLALEKTNLIAERVVVLPTGSSMTKEMVKVVSAVVRTLVEGRA